MSSLYSDPPFGRGQTLLAGSIVDFDANGLPIAGGEIAGSVKVFPDVSPGTGPASVRYSNRLVYCVAARYVGGTTLNPGSNGADRGKLVVLDRSSPLATFSTFAVGADVANGRLVGVLDEYLTSEVRTNDIVWIVVKGPTQIAKAANAAISVATSAAVEATGTAGSGVAIAGATAANTVAFSIEPFGTVTTTAASGTGTSATVAVTTTLANYPLLAVGANLSGTNVPSNSKITSVSSLVVSNTTATVTAVIGIDGNVATAVASGATLTIGGPSYAASMFRAVMQNARV